MRSTRRAVLPLVAVAALLGSAGPAAAASGPDASAAAASSKPRAGGYYTGTTAQGREVTLDVSPNGRRITAVAWQFDCAGQPAQGSLQSLPIKRKGKSYRFAGASADVALLFLDSYLSEPASVSTVSKFTKRGRRVSGVFNVVSPSCGDTGPIAYSASLR